MHGELTIDSLANMVDEAIMSNATYIGVKIQMQGLTKPEVIINEMENFKSKLEYYKQSYNTDLTLKAFNGIKIVGFTFGNSYDDIESDLVYKIM